MALKITLEPLVFFGSGSTFKLNSKREIYIYIRLHGCLMPHHSLILFNYYRIMLYWLHFIIEPLYAYI